LNRHGARHGVDHAAELGEQVVAVHPPRARRVGNRRRIALRAPRGCEVVSATSATVTDRVGTEDRELRFGRTAFGPRVLADLPVPRRSVTVGDDARSSRRCIPRPALVRWISGCRLHHRGPLRGCASRARSAAGSGRGARARRSFTDQPLSTREPYGMGCPTTRARRGSRAGAAPRALPSGRGRPAIDLSDDAARSLPAAAEAPVLQRAAGRRRGRTPSVNGRWSVRDEPRSSACG
jgi:hypothetical protein